MENKGRDSASEAMAKEDLDTLLVAEDLLALPSVGQATLIRSPVRPGGQGRGGLPGLKGQPGQPDRKKKGRADLSRKEGPGQRL